MSYSENNFYPDGKLLGIFYYNEPGGYLIKKNVNIFTDEILTRRETYSGGQLGVTATISYAEEFEKGIDGNFKYKETREYSDGINVSKKIRKCSTLSGEACCFEVYENGTDLSYTINHEKEICPNTGNVCCKQVKVCSDFEIKRERKEKEEKEKEEKEKEEKNSEEKEKEEKKSESK